MRLVAKRCSASFFQWPTLWLALVSERHRYYCTTEKSELSKGNKRIKIVLVINVLGMTSEKRLLLLAHYLTKEPSARLARHRIGHVLVLLFKGRAFRPFHYPIDPDTPTRSDMACLLYPSSSSSITTIGWFFGWWLCSILPWLGKDFLQSLTVLGRITTL